MNGSKRQTTRRQAKGYHRSVWGETPPPDTGLDHHPYGTKKGIKEAAEKRGITYVTVKEKSAAIRRSVFGEERANRKKNYSAYTANKNLSIFPTEKQLRLQLLRDTWHRVKCKEEGKDPQVQVVKIDPVTKKLSI